jgi:hypothetical protein
VAAVVHHDGGGGTVSGGDRLRRWWGVMRGGGAPTVSRAEEVEDDHVRPLCRRERAGRVGWDEKGEWAGRGGRGGGPRLG